MNLSLCPDFDKKLARIRYVPEAVQPYASFGISPIVTGIILVIADISGVLAMIFDAISLLMFAGSTMRGWSYYGERCAGHLLGPKVNLIYRILWIPPIVIGDIGRLEEVWAMADTLNALMAFPNLIGLLLLSGVVYKLTCEFFDKQAKEK